MSEYNDKIIKILGKLIPEDYDLQLLPQHLLHEISKVIFDIELNLPYDVEITIGNDETGKYKIINNGVYTESYHLKITPDTQKIILINSNGKIIFYDINLNKVTEKQLSNYYIIFRSVDVNLLNKRAILLLSPDEKYLLAYRPHDYWVIGIWQLDSDKFTRINLNDRIVGVYFSKNNEITVYHAHGDMTIWNVENGELLDNKNVFDYEVNEIIRSPNGQKIIVDCYDSIDIFDINTHKQLCHLTNEYARLIIFSPDSQKILYETFTCVFVCDTNGKEFFRMYTDETIKSILFSLDSQKIVVSYDSCVEIYHVNSGKLLEKIMIK